MFKNKNKLFGLQVEKLAPGKMTKYFHYDNPRLQWNFLYFSFSAFLTLWLYKWSQIVWYLQCAAKLLQAKLKESLESYSIFQKRNISFFPCMILLLKNQIWLNLYFKTKIFWSFSSFPAGSFYLKRHMCGCPSVSQTVEKCAKMREKCEKAVIHVDRIVIFTSQSKWKC